MAVPSTNSSLRSMTDPASRVLDGAEKQKLHPIAANNQHFTTLGALEMPVLVAGAHRQVTAASRFGFSSSSSSSYYGSSPLSDSDSDDGSSISPPPSYHTVYPPSPPSSILSSSGKSYVNPLHKALSSPSTTLKPSLSHRSSSERTTSLLTTIFPSSSPVHELPSTSVSMDDVVPSFQGQVLDNEVLGTRTLYVGGGSYEDVNLRETICAVLEKAEEELGCSGVVMCLEKKHPDLGNLLHSLMYVGGTITTLPFAPSKEYVLVGLDL